MAKMYKFIRDDWFTLTGDAGVKMTVYPDQIIDVTNPPREWREAYDKLIARGLRNVSPERSLMNAIEHWTKKSNPLFIPYTKNVAQAEQREKESSRVVDDVEAVVKPVKSVSKKK